MSDLSSAFLSKSRRLFRSDYLPKLRVCVAALEPEDVWWRPNEGSNSVGNLLLHLNGNLTQWLIGGVGQQRVERDRQREFDERNPLEGAVLLERLSATVERGMTILESLSPEELLARRQIQGYDVSVLDAIYHVTEHFSMHLGQIILITKMRTGRDLRLWQPPQA